MSEGWTEQDSATFLRDADCFVPERELLVESVCRLIPAGVKSDLVVELCCGDGGLRGSAEITYQIRPGEMV